ncbi:MAG: hypothetical protein CMQ17_10780 [Gammaproteobacteria bacterium]|jgi:outer membrane protein assembly factor BamE|nr:hypothetical protein [Gammaproteobacteria bacterium]|tara:strand:+ start:9209 stop:9571 length:363 start_codon:yes stop_codon:yes gene_type:complete
MNSLSKSLIIASSALILSACGIGALQFPGVYKIDIPQGNVITQIMVDQLRPGMTKRQVIFVMGTPLVRDPFHQDRWDYIYSFQPGGGERGQERISVFFADDALVSFSGDFVPSAQAGANP